MPQIIPAEIRDTKTGQIWRFPRAIRGKLVSESEADEIYAKYCPRFSNAGRVEAMRPKGPNRRFVPRKSR